MNAVEIEEQVSALAELPFDPDEFPYAFLEAFGNKSTTIKRLRTGTSNKSEQGGLLQANNIHLQICDECGVSNTLAQLKARHTKVKSKAKLSFMIISTFLTTLASSYRLLVSAQLNQSAKARLALTKRICCYDFKEKSHTSLLREHSQTKYLN